MTCVTILEKEIHCKLQKSCYTLQSPAATCNGFKQSIQSLKNVELNSTLCNCCKPKKVARQVEKRTCYLQLARPLPATCKAITCNLQGHYLQLARPLPATCKAIAAQFAKQLYRVTLILEFCSTFCNDCREY